MPLAFTFFFSPLFELFQPVSLSLLLNEGNRVNRSQICVDKLNSPLPHFITRRLELTDELKPN